MRVNAVIVVCSTFPVETAASALLQTRTGDDVDKANGRDVIAVKIFPFLASTSSKQDARTSVGETRACWSNIRSERLAVRDR